MNHELFMIHFYIVHRWVYAHSLGLKRAQRVNCSYCLIGRQCVDWIIAINLTLGYPFFIVGYSWRSSGTRSSAGKRR